MITIKCPLTDRIIETGVRLDKDAFENSDLHEGPLQCPSCGQMHGWEKKDVLPFK
jgi:hypothetical protein